jgi:2-oxo-4-hydroxy-4-carboxy-5-ureidoimidazoline decarboxylase
LTVSDHPPTLSLDQINRMSPRDFRRALGDVFEGSPWIAERALAARPFASRDGLHEAMVRVMREASREERLALLRAHPDLAIRAARASALSAASRSEQSGAGLDRLSDHDYQRFERLNRRYRQRFGFPFIIAVRRHDAESILAAFERRLLQPVDAEIETAVSEVADITRFRLATLVTA